MCIRDSPSAEVEKLRNAVTKANGEAAEYKKQLKAKQMCIRDRTSPVAKKRGEPTLTTAATDSMPMTNIICWISVVAMP